MVHTLLVSAAKLPSKPYQHSSALSVGRAVVKSRLRSCRASLARPATVGCGAPERRSRPESCRASFARPPPARVAVSASKLPSKHCEIANARMLRLSPVTSLGLKAAEQALPATKPGLQQPICVSQSRPESCRASIASSCSCPCRDRGSSVSAAKLPSKHW